MNDPHYGSQNPHDAFRTVATLPGAQAGTGRVLLGASASNVAIVRVRQSVKPVRRGSAGLTTVMENYELSDHKSNKIGHNLHHCEGWSRRYNQSGALARVISRQTGVKLASEALRRVRATEQQIGLSRPQRASNVQGAFNVAADRTADIERRRVVLIDDVLTSGATTDACARALLRAKAAQVDVLVFARVVDTHRAPI
jgi:Phosphoribosyl transferase domain